MIYLCRDVIAHAQSLHDRPRSFGGRASLVFLLLLNASLVLFYQSGQDGPIIGGISLPEAGGETSDPNTSPATSFLPGACHEHIVTNFPNLGTLMEQGKDSKMGVEGGEWSACTHIKNYGMNFAAFFARHLAYGLRPKSVLEFGCGLGTTSDFLARSVPGGSRVVCVEPEPMIGEVFGEGAEASRGFPLRPVQLSMLSFGPEARACADELFAPNMGFELVLSLEVAEHVPPEHTGELIQRLGAATSKYLVFSAARPGQGGTGHIEESMHDRTWWIEQFTNVDCGAGGGKLKLLPQLSRALRHVTAYQARSFDLGTNLIAFGCDDAKDQPKVPQIAHDCFFKPFFVVNKEIKGDPEDEAYAKKHNMSLSLELERPCPDSPTEEDRRQRVNWVEGQTQALWPELDLLIRRVRKGEMTCG